MTSPLLAVVIASFLPIAVATEEREEEESPLRTWQWIVIHHSATRTGSAEVFDADHRARGMANGLAYHFVIDNGRRGTTDGFVETGDRWTKQLPGGHCRHETNNEFGIGICLVGDFSDSRPTAKQFESLLALIKQLQSDYQIPNERIVGHGDLFGESTECPGARFPWKELRKRLNETPTLTAATQKTRAADTQ